MTESWAGHQWERHVFAVRFRSDKIENWDAPGSAEGWRRERISNMLGQRWGGAYHDCRLGSSWAPERENEGGTEAGRQSWGCQGCAYYKPHSHTHQPGFGISCCPSPPPQSTAFPLPLLFCRQKFGPSEHQALAEGSKFGNNTCSKNIIIICVLIPSRSAGVSLSLSGQLIIQNLKGEWEVNCDNLPQSQHRFIPLEKKNKRQRALRE